MTNGTPPKSDHLTALLSDYKERCADQRAKAEQYAKLWIYMLSVIVILFSVAQAGKTGVFSDVVGDGVMPRLMLVIIVSVLITFMGYTNVTHSVLLLHLKGLEQRITDMSGHDMKWFRAIREVHVHPANKWIAPKAISVILWPLLVLVPITYGWSLVDLLKCLFDKKLDFFAGAAVVGCPLFILINIVVIWFMKNRLKEDVDTFRTSTATTSLKNQTSPHGNKRS